jgi:hypothetical protein
MNMPLAYRSKVAQLVKNESPITLEAIKEDILKLKECCWDVLYYATKEQVTALADSGDVDKYYISLHQEYQESVEKLRADFA